METVRLMFAGASGTGKTTCAKAISQSFKQEVPFVSGSVSDLIPKTKDLSHEEMLSRDSKDLYMEDFQIVNLRKKLYGGYNSFVTDRSYLDSAAYFVYKQADKIPQCEMENFLMICKQLLNMQATHLVLFDFNDAMIRNWVVEDNHKRILNRFFQAEITSIMKMVLNYWEAEQVRSTEYEIRDKNIFKKPISIPEGFTWYRIKSLYGVTEILITENTTNRLDILKYWIGHNNFKEYAKGSNIFSFL